MRISSLLILGVPFLVAALLSLVAATFAVSAIEDSSEIGVRRVLDDGGLGWSEVQADGLRVELYGTAPSEAERFRAISTVRGVVDAARVIDRMEVAPAEDLAPPRFSAEILRNDSGISIIGLIPAAADREALVTALHRVVGDGRVADLLEIADYPVPDGWEDAMGFALGALTRLPRAKISVGADRVEVTAMADSREARIELERALRRSAPGDLDVVLSISAPRPVITPFTLRFIIDENGSRFDACSAQDESARDQLLAAARAAGLEGAASCTIGMGVPSPRWGRAGALAIAALDRLGQGSVTMADADITLVAAEGTDPALFGRVVGELENALPDVFALAAVLPEPEETGVAGPPEFTATLSPEGLLQMRGRLNDATLRQMTDAFARARFGSDSVYTATRIVPDLPDDWPVRVLAGLEALSRLINGAVIVTPEMVSLRGATHDEDASATISGFLSEKLGQGAQFDLDITYRPPPEPEDATPDPAACEAQIVAVQAESKINFEPGSATITADALDTLNAIADILRDCGPLELEIQGHTDSQGREAMNQQLSQDRAQSVLDALRARRVLTATYEAVGYGESRPIADNDTEEGREANRRIEFKVILPEPELSPGEVTPGSPDEKAAATRRALGWREAQQDEQEAGGASE
ncbi:MAG TPA: hypothetical protein DEA05_04575 [Rhodobacteraceae bacterium]|nr:hypothetical protein [Paracoccaceae bacterium]